MNTIKKKFGFSSAFELKITALFSSLFFILGITNEIQAQTAPYSLSPIWVFGNKAQFDFTGGGNPTQPARTDNIVANEGSSTLCDRDKNLMVYDNNVRVAGGNYTPLGTAMNASSSSTQGGIILPNPANPATQYFIITGNAESTYSTEPNDNAKAGIKVYSGQKSGATVTAPALVTNLESDPIREYLYSSSNGDYGYWVITAKVLGSGNTEFYAWPITTAGTVGAKVTSSNATAIWNEQYQGCIKVSRCQTRIALAQGSSVQIYEWDRSTGKIGTQLVKHINSDGDPKYYGCEFSPNGEYLFVSTLSASPLERITVSSGIKTNLAQNASGSLQLGPNNVIYVANGLDGADNNVVGTITNPDGGGTYTASAVTLQNGSSVRLGISNIPWLNPQKPTIAGSNNSCGKYTFTPDFVTHFNDAITVSKAVWDLGDGTIVTNTGANAMNPVIHDYTTLGNKTVTVTLTDSVCSQTWVGTFTQNVDCVLPVSLINFEVEKYGNSSAQLTWTTSEERNNSYFEIQHSTDALHFTTIGTVKGNGNTSSATSYSYIHQSPFPGVNYYRLVQYDFNGDSEVLPVRSLSLKGIEVMVAPNPTQDAFNVAISGADAATIVVKDITGRTVLTEEVENLEGQIRIGQNLPAAPYILQVITDVETKTIKLEKIRN
ncbi:MAG TPA: T9SS type A sorting domain-containing protein [Cytophagaceae bacterium]